MANTYRISITSIRASAKIVLNEIVPPMLWSLVGYIFASMNLSFVWIFHLTIILSLKKLDYELSPFLIRRSRRKGIFDVSRQSSIHGEKVALESELQKQFMKYNEQPESSMPDLSGIPLSDILPSWAMYPDFERAEWVNTIISRIWPTIAGYFKKIVRDKIHSKIKFMLEARCLKSVADSFDIKAFCPGQFPPRITGIKVHEKMQQYKQQSSYDLNETVESRPTHGYENRNQVDERETKTPGDEQIKSLRQDDILIDFNLVYPSDCEMKIGMMGITGKISNFRLCGDVRVVLTLPSKDEDLRDFSPHFLSGMKAYFLLDPTIEVELGAAINAMLKRTGFLDDVHEAISEGLGSFKFVRSFRKVKNIASRKKSRIKKRSSTLSCRSRSSSVISEDSIISPFPSEGAKNDSEVENVLGGLSSMMLNLSGIDLEEQKLPENSTNKAGTESKVEIENRERHVEEMSSNVDVTAYCDTLNKKTATKKSKKSSTSTKTSGIGSALTGIVSVMSLSDTHVREIVLSSADNVSDNYAQEQNSQKYFETIDSNGNSPMVRLTITHNKQKERLKIVVHEAQGLPMDEDFTRDDDDDENDSLPNPCISLFLAEKTDDVEYNDQDVISDALWHRRPEINTTSMKINTIQPVFEETFYFNDVPPEKFDIIGIEAVIDDKKCLLNNTMGQALIRLDYLELSKNDEVTGWFQLQNETDLKCQSDSDSDSC